VPPPLAVIESLGGAARWAELARHGVSRRSLAGAVARGELVKLDRGLYCLPGGESAWVTQAARGCAVLSCGSAAQHHGLEVFGEVGLHLSAAGPRNVRRGVVFHRRAVDCDARVTTLRQTLVDCCRCLPTRQAVSVLDSALRQGRVEVDELQQLAPGAGRWARRIRHAVDLVDPAAQSVLESAARVLMVEGGLTGVESQIEVRAVGWVDFVVDGWLVVEVDGYAVHRDRFREDRRRDAELVRQGYVVLRFTYEDLERRPEWVLTVVSETLALGRPAHRVARER
jgi:very-short-patch-repair endonuclease